jgi:hypothetical protein
MLSKANGVLAEIYQRYTGVELVTLPQI